MALLERAAFLDKLGAFLAEAGEGRGALVLLAGEAGAGKTALVREFCETHRRTARVLVGACDALSTPQPLGSQARSMTQVVRDVGDDSVGPVEQRKLESQGGLIVENVLPPVRRDELGEHDCD
jgi:predicted ATPase